MRWSSARVAWSVVVGLAAFLLVAAWLANLPYPLPGLGDEKHYFYRVMTRDARVILLPYEKVVGMVTVLALGLACGLLPGGSWPAVQHRFGDPGAQRSRQRALRAAGAVFVLAVLIAVVVANTTRGRTRTPQGTVAAFEVAVVSGAALVWLLLGANRGAAFATLVVFMAGAATMGRSNPWWTRVDFGLIAGPPLVVHSAFVALVAAVPVALIMFLTAELRLSALFRLAPGLSVVLVSGMFVLVGYVSVFTPFRSAWKRSLTVSSHR